VGDRADVLVMDVDVTSFITPKMLREARPAGYDIILIPGAIIADFGPVSRELETKIRLGPMQHNHRWKISGPRCPLRRPHIIYLYSTSELVPF